MQRKAVLVLFLVFALRPMAADAVEDSVLIKACPGLSAWAETHPHHNDEATIMREAQREFSEPGLRRTLAERAASDQNAREALSDAGMPDKATIQEMVAVDADNLRWLKAMVTEHGFPTPAQVGEEGVGHAWLLLQHADADPAFQEAMLEKLMANPENGGVGKPELAMLSDRLLIAQGKPQRYATQFVPDRQGNLVPQQPIEDFAQVDQRRSAMGLMPLATYQCMVRATYGPAPSSN